MYCKKFCFKFYFDKFKKIFFFRVVKNWKELVTYSNSVLKAALLNLLKV